MSTRHFMDIVLLASIIKTNPSEIKKYDNLTNDEIIYLLNVNYAIYYSLKEEQKTKDVLKYIYLNKKIFDYSFLKYIDDDEFIMSILSIDLYFIDKIFDKLPMNKRDKYIDYIIAKGYSVSDNSPFSLQGNSKLALVTIKKNINKINNFSIECIDDNIVNYLIDNNYKYEYLTPIWMFEVEKLVMYFIKDDVTLFKYAYGNGITENTLKYAMSMGYDINTSKYLYTNKVILKEALKTNPQLLNKLNKKVVDEELINIALNNGYHYSFIGERYNIEDEENDYIEPINNLFLLEYDKIFINEFFNFNKNILVSDKIKINEKYIDIYIDYFIKSNCDITEFRNIELLNNDKMKNYIFNKYFNSNLAKKILNEIEKKYPKESLYFNLKKLSYVLNDNFIKAFGYNNTLLIIKYLVVSHDEFNIENVLLFDVYKVKKLFDKININNNYLINIKILFNYFNNNIKLLENILYLDDIENIDYNSLISLITDKNSINCTNIKNINNDRYNYYLNSNLNIKDKILGYLFSSNLLDANNFLKNVVNSITIEYLSNIHPNITYEISYLESIVNSNDDLYLNILFNKIKNYSKMNSLDKLRNYFILEYSKLYKNNLTKLGNNTTKYIENIPVIEYNGEDFSFIVHSINAFDTSYIPDNDYYNIDKNDFGRSYLCTSYINQDHIYFINNNNCKLIFNNFSLEQLFLMKDNDIYSNGSKNNSLNINSHSPLFLSPKILSYLSFSYNEIDFYRQNNQGDYIKPTGVLCFDNIDNSSIHVARFLNIPIVLINREKYINKNIEDFNKYEEELVNGNYTNIVDYICLSKKINKELDLELLKNIISNVDNDVLNKIMYYLNLVGYDHLLNNEKIM